VDKTDLQFANVDGVQGKDVARSKNAKIDGVKNATGLVAQIPQQANFLSTIYATNDHEYAYYNVGTHVDVELSVAGRQNPDGCRFQ
jgi:hypothetical protein